VRELAAGQVLDADGLRRIEIDEEDLPGDEANQVEEPYETGQQSQPPERPLRKAEPLRESGEDRVALLGRAGAQQDRFAARPRRVHTAVLGLCLVDAPPPAAIVVVSGRWYAILGPDSQMPLRAQGSVMVMAAVANRRGMVVVEVAHLHGHIGEERQVLVQQPVDERILRSHLRLPPV
jgi:hypothetical protein